jgi:hypothetical protein
VPLAHHKANTKLLGIKPVPSKYRPGKKPPEPQHCIFHVIIFYINVTVYHTMHEGKTASRYKCNGQPQQKLTHEL